MTCDVCVVREMGEATKRAPDLKPKWEVGRKERKMEGGRKEEGKEGSYGGKWA